MKNFSRSLTFLIFALLVSFLPAFSAGCEEPRWIQDGQATVVELPDITTNGLILRTEPSFMADQVVQIAAFHKRPLVVREGPICREGVNWYRVIWNGYPGYVPEKNQKGQYLIGSFCPNKYYVHPGDTAFVDTKFSNLVVRSKPSLNGAVITKLDDRTIVEIIDGPYCFDENTWFYISDGINEGFARGCDEEGKIFLSPYVTDTFTVRGR